MSGRQARAFLRGTSPEMRDVIRDAEARGWTAGATRNGHIRLTKPGCGQVIGGSSTHGNGALWVRQELARAERRATEGAR